MKLSFIFILLSYFGLIISKTVYKDLTNATALTINDIKGYYYVFSIPAKLNQQGHFVIRNNYVNDRPFIELKVHEFHYYTGSVKESHVYTKDDYSPKKLDNELVTSIPHKVRNSDTRRLGIMIQAKSTVKYLTVLLVLGDNIFYLKGK